MHRRPNKVEALIGMGCYIQMNSKSVIGGFLDTKASYNRKLVQKDLVHFIASDCHSDMARAPIMQTAVEHLLRKCDEEHINRIFIHNPSKILENTYI
jgi:protein-tyrosine phosphatase